MAIFISYRRDDSLAAAGRIDDVLRREFGDRNVYRDIDSIPLGVDFVDHLQRALDRCYVCLAIIGPRWNPARLGEHDFVRRELESALSRDVLVVPLLVDGGTLPAPEELPECLRPLLRRQALRVDSGADFNGHVVRLVRSLRAYLIPRSTGAVQLMEDVSARRTQDLSWERPFSALAPWSATLDVLRARLLGDELTGHVFLDGHGAEQSRLADFRIAGHVFDLAILFVKRAMSQLADQMAYVTLMSPLMSALSAPVVEERKRNMELLNDDGRVTVDRGEILAVLKNREDFRTGMPAALGQRIVIVAGRREHTSKRELAELSEFNSTHRSCQILTWDTIAERFDVLRKAEREQR